MTEYAKQLQSHAKRRARIWELRHVRKKSVKWIAAKEGVSEQRIRQLLAKYESANRQETAK